jgi:hypothetical protein
MSSLFNRLPDSRQPSKADYSYPDALMSGFACMFFQDPSLLIFQKRLKDEKQRNNLHTLFGIDKTPESTQMRTMIDQVESHRFRALFPTYLSRLQQGNHLKPFELFPGLHFCPIDGTQYFSSQHIHCQNCCNYSGGSRAPMRLALLNF